MTKVNIKGQDYEVTRDNLNNPRLDVNDGFVLYLTKKSV